MRTGFGIAGACLVLGLFSAPADAGYPHEHDGFFLRLSLGVGAADTELDDEATDSEIQLEGTAGDVNIAIGGVVAENLAIHATIFGWSITDPDAEIREPGFEEEGELEGDLSLGAFGGGITYYLMPVNIYFSGSIGAGRLTFDPEGFDEVDSDTGIVGDFTVGKEWFVSDNWGLGFAGGMSVHSIPDGEFDENWTGKSFVLRFSSTFN